jgi:diguanylate cyclase (GGDEF)-like protein
MFRTIFASLRVRLILLTLVVLVPALGLLVYVADRDRENARDEVKSRVLYLARLAAAEESQIIQSTRQLLQHLAQTPEARGEISQAACNEMVARQIKLYFHYNNLGVIGPGGIRFCSVLLPEQSTDLSMRTYYRRAVETRDFSVGDYQLGTSTGSAGVGFGYPVLEATGEVRGVVFATLNLEWLGKSLARAQLPPEASLTVVDSQGNMLARFPETEGRIGRPIDQTVLKQMFAQGGSGILEGIATDGRRRVWGFVPLHQAGSGIIFVRVGMPVAAAYGGINGTFYRNLLLIAATALLIMGIAWAGAERLVVRPVKRLTEAARHVGKGNLSARTGLPHGDGEFGQLARVFDDMADSIESEEAALERLMAQQKEANANLIGGIGELERLNREITQLGRMSNVLQACQSVEEACGAVVQSGQILFPTEAAALYLMRSSRNCLEYKAGWGGAGVEQTVLLPESCWALRRGQVYRFEPPHDGLPCEHVTAEPRPAPYICVPLVAQSDILGLLHIRFPAPDGTQSAGTIESRLQLATTFADQAGLALANLKLREVLKQQSIRDPLTGLHNRRFLEESLELELARARRSKAPLALIMADIDHFKRFNDGYGHDAGDAVLRIVAQTLKSQIRGSDIACRFGGEEFTLIMPEAALEAARKKTESLRQAIASLVLSHAGQSLGTITMSFGVAIYPEHGSDSTGLLQAADSALYRAKNEGRNRVEISRIEPSAATASAS